jgi:hypothetical protein
MRAFTLQKAKVGTPGVNIYQVYYARKRWWLSSVSWDAEHAINEISRELK